MACGLATRKDPQSQQIQDYCILTDISVGMTPPPPPPLPSLPPPPPSLLNLYLHQSSQVIEEAVGNMDFKMAGTREGITSLQVL